MAAFTAPNYRAPSGLCGVIRLVTQACGLGYRISAPAGLKSRCDCATPSLARRVWAENGPANSLCYIELQNCSKSLLEVLTVTTLFVNN